MSTLVALFIAFTFILSACGGGNPANATSNQPKKGGTIHVGLPAEPVTMDPLNSASLYDSDIMADMYDSLLKYDTQNKIQPDLAASYAYASPTVLNLTLRTDVTFQDGTPFNADAVVFNIERFLTDPASPRYSDLTSVAAVKKVSDFQVQILLKQPFAPLLDILTGDVGEMLSPTAVKKLGKNLQNTPIDAGSGAFIFVEWIKGDHLTLKANPHYWKKDAQGNQLPYLQSIRFQTITDGSVMYANLQTAQIQVAGTISPNEISVAKKNPSLTYKQIIGPGWGGLFINNTAAPMNNVHVRRAIAWAVNRQDILDHVFFDVGTIATGPLSSASFAYNKNLVSYTYDPSKAKAELAQSGLSHVSFALDVTNSPANIQEAQFIQSELQAVGITMTIKLETFPALVMNLQTFSYQASALGWTGGEDPYDTMDPLFTTVGGFNYIKYSNPQV
ncbi:MAG: ABC transporter substrate-binding protein, partial [Candidatus Micrarchaeaceae archaeon]